MASKRRRSRQSRRSRKHGNAYDRLVPFDTWVDALRWAAAEKPIFYQEILDKEKVLQEKHNADIAALATQETAAKAKEAQDEERARREAAKPPAPPKPPGFFGRMLDKLNKPL